MDYPTSNLAACLSCNKEVQDALFDSSFLPNLFTIIAGFLILILIVLMFTYFSAKKFRKHSQWSKKDILDPVPLSTAAVVMGLGLGGFIDGILFHQILQLHAMVSNKLPIDTFVGKSVNMFWDGIFHAVTWIAVLIGFILLVRLLKKKNINPDPKLAIGGTIAGWGIFNTVEGMIHHQILKLHNVNEFTMNTELWNYSFLFSGLLFLLIGFLCIYDRKHFPPRLD